jgi:hypothetical protein
MKVKSSLCCNWAPRHESVLGEWRHTSKHCFTTALDGGEWSASHHGRFTPRETAPGNHWTGDWVGPRTVLDAVVKRKISSPRQESTPRTPIVQPVAQLYTDWAITALLTFLVSCNRDCLFVFAVFMSSPSMFAYTRSWCVPFSFNPF